MIIGIDGNEANVKKRVGINTYAYELIKNLSKLQAEWKNEHSLIVYLKDEPVGGMPKETQNFKYKILKGKGSWILKKLMPHLFFAKEKPDIFFSPSHYTPLFAPMSRVCSIMDLGYLEFSGQFRKIDFWQLKVWSAISIFVSKSIIAISNTTKKDIVRHYPFAKDKVYVTKLGYDKSKFNLQISDEDVRRVKNRYSIVSDYVLYLGTLKPSKNIEGLIEAFSLLKATTNPVSFRDTLKNIKLVIAGKKGWHWSSIYKKVKELGLENEIIFTGFVSEKDKPALIKGARVFALPSFWEGFGLDVLSAMAVGTPIVVSGAGSLPEVVGDAGVQVDPKKPESICEGLTEVLSANATKYNRMRALGLMEVEAFSWETTARKTLDIIITTASKK
jgi:glycosyltransferase involved in cell wall biosynthesis